MKICPDCGTRLADTADVCTVCGALVISPEQQKQAPAPEPATITQPTSKPKNTQVQQPRPAPQTSTVSTPAFGYSHWIGGVFETIMVSIAATLITICTLGLGTPWAVVFVLKHVITNTVIDGKLLKFDGTGLQFLGNIIKWTFFTICTCGINSFFIMPRMYGWIASHTHFA